MVVDPLFEHTMVVGEGKPYLSALVVLNPDLWPGLTREYELDPQAQESLSDRRLQSELLNRIKAALKDFPGYAKIRRIRLLLEPWTVENGLLTPTLKVKRAKVLERFAEQIETLYEEGPAGGRH
jgi:long-chain acyl-CoA synthetase